MPDHQGVTIGGGPGGLAQADRPARAHLVFDEHRVPDLRGKLLRHQARDHVGRRSGTVRDDDPKGLIRVGLAPRGRADRKYRGEQDKTA